MEEELNHDWKEKCDRLLSASLEKHKRELGDVVNEKKWLEEKLATMESKVIRFSFVPGDIFTDIMILFTDTMSGLI